MLPPNEAADIDAAMDAAMVASKAARAGLPVEKVDTFKPDNCMLTTGGAGGGGGITQEPETK